jgi:PAS domain S-box-containing protein
MGKPLRVLMVEDSEDHALLLRHELNRGGYDLTYERVETAKDMKVALARQDWDLIISDYHMPRFRGLDALKLAQERIPDVPFILVSGQIGEDKAVAAMKAGAHDYLPKDNLKRLIPAVERELREAESRRARRKAEGELKESNRRIATILESITDAFCSLNQQWLFTYANKQAEQVLEKTREELLGHSAWEVFPEAVDSAFYTQFHKAVREQVTVEFEVYYPPMEKWFEVHAYPSANGLSIYFKDINEAKYREEALRLSEYQYSTLAKASPVGLFRTDAEGHCLYVNERWCAIAGMTQEEALGEGWGKAIHPDDRERVFTAWYEAARQRLPFQLEYRFQKPDGVTTWVFGQSVEQTSPSDEVTGYIGTITDITTNKQAEEALKKYADEFQELYNHAPCGYHSLDKEGTIILTNETELDMLGYGRDELLGKKFSDLLTAEGLKTFQDNFPQFQQRGWVRDLQFQMIRKDGTLLPVSLNSTAIKDAQGNYLMSRSAILDITDRKRAEAEQTKLLDVIEASLNEIYIFDADTLYFQHVNAGALNNLGYTAEKMRTMTPIDIKPEFDEASFRKMIAPLLRHEQEKLVFQTVHKRADESRYPVESHLQLIERNEERIFLAVILDITERKQTEEVLRASEERLSLALDVARMVTWDFDILADRLVASGRMDLVFGLPVGAPAPSYEDFLDFVHPDDRATVFQALTRAVEEGVGYQLEYRVIWPDGTLHWIAAEGQAYYDPTNRPIRLVGVAIDITERKQAEEALRDSETRLQAVLDNATAVIYVKDLQSRYILINHRYETLFHLNREEVRGKTDHDLFPKEIADVFRANDESVIASGTALEWEEVAPQEDGLHIYLSVKFPLCDSRGIPYAVCGMSTDITERKQAEVDLRATTSRLTTLITNMQAGILVEDESRKIVLVNQAFCQIFGIQAPPEALIGADCSRAAEETKGLFAEPERFVQRIEQILEERCTIAEEILLANGQIFERDYVPIFVGEDYRGHLWQYRDITERKRAEEVLRQQSKRFQLFSEITLNIRQSLKLDEILQTTVSEVQQLLKADRVLIFQLQSDGSGNVVQEAVVPGWPVTLGQNLFDPCFNADFKDRYRQGRVSSIADIDQGNIERCHVEFLQQFEVKANLVVPILVKEDVWGLLIAHQCAAPRQWATLEIELMQQLGDQIGIALTQAQLLEQETKQRQELVRSNSDLQQFAYVASHDLQEPLRMVASYLQLLERRYKDRLDADASEFIQYAVDGAGRMQTLINDLLAYSRVGTQGKPFKLTDYGEVLKQTLLQLKMSIEETGAVITHDDPLPEVMADESQLIQVLQNLVSNAIKFQSDQVPHIHVGAEHIEGEWVFSVKDQGIGMDPQYKDRIFLIFQRLHNRTEYRGTGIGLAICKRIIERHGGRIWVESEPEKGSTFYFTIPDRGGDNPQ